MFLVVGLLGLEARLFMALFGGGLEQAMWIETLASVANAMLLMVIVLALSTWMNNIVAAIVAFIYSFVGGVVVALHAQLGALGALSAPAIVRSVLSVLYWLVPHQLMSDAQRQIVKAEFEMFKPQGQGAPTADQILRSVPGASGIQDILWWAFLVALMATFVYIAVRRRQV